MTMTAQQKKRLIDGVGVRPLPPPPQYTGPAVPIAYDDKWQFYVNLSPAQIAWFQAQPEWTAYVAAQPAPIFEPQRQAAANAAGGALLKINA